jgi:DNA-directed RNA polymerase subunit RPC12/RpoP
MADELQEKILKCKDCSKEFVWTKGEQEFFHEKGLKNKPARCKECRKANRAQLESEYFKIVCVACGQIGEAVFQQSDPDAQVYCKNCFDKYFNKV